MSPSHYLAILVTEFINICVLIIHEKKQVSLALQSFELSLPLGKITRQTMYYVESIIVQLPCIFLLLIACLGELHAYGHGFWVQDLVVIFCYFLFLMLLNHNLFSFVKKLHQLGTLTKTAKNDEMKNTIRPFGAKAIKAFVAVSTRKRHFIFSTTTLTMLSLLGWSIALVPSGEQPKHFLWNLIFGLILLVLTPLSYTLDDLDQENSAYLMTLPTSMKKQRLNNRKILLWFILPFLFEVAVWPISANFGWRDSLILLQWAGLLIGCANAVHVFSRKWFIPNFVTVILIVSWMAERFHL
jgi:hypothetical protein